MRRTLCILAFLLIVLILPMSGEIPKADNRQYQSGDFAYTLDNSNGAIITSYFGKDTELIIPSSIDDHLVVSIGDEIFSNCDNITSIALPEGLKSIGNDAFYSCFGLASIILPEGLESIGKNAFNGCTSLTSIELPKGLRSIGISAFQSCMNLASITFPNGLESIGNAAFNSCVNLSSIVLPEGIKSIGYGTFSACKNLSAITLPESLETIGESAFRGCKKLTSITLPGSLTSIDDAAFDGGVTLTYPRNSYVAEWVKQNSKGSSVNITPPNSVVSAADTTPPNSGASAAEMPQYSNDPKATTVCDTFKEVLSSHGIAYFRIQSDFSFSEASGKESIRDFDSSEDAVTRDLDTKEAENMLKRNYGFLCLRIENGVVSTDNADFQCEASVLPDNGGVSLRIHGDNGEINGVIIGDELVADASYGLSGVVYHVGHTMVSSGSFRVGLKEVQPSEIPPKPVNITSIIKNENNSITLTWEDPNPAGVVSSYAIYRKKIEHSKFDKIENVKDISTWTDTTKFSWLDAVAYIIVVEGTNGMTSESSNYVYISML